MGMAPGRAEAAAVDAGRASGACSGWILGGTVDIPAGYWPLAPSLVACTGLAFDPAGTGGAKSRCLGGPLSHWSAERFSAFAFNPVNVTAVSTRPTSQAHSQQGARGSRALGR